MEIKRERFFLFFFSFELAGRTFVFSESIISTVYDIYSQVYVMYLYLGNYAMIFHDIFLDVCLQFL